MDWCLGGGFDVVLMNLMILMNLVGLMGLIGFMVDWRNLIKVRGSR